MLHLFTTQRVTFLIIFAVLGAVTVIHDPDFYFHLVAGQYILAHQSLPHVDVFSFTMAGAPWHMHEWLFELLLALLYGIGGERLIVWSIAALGLAAFYLLFRAGLGGRKGGIFWLLPALVLLVFYLPFVTQRPQVITYAAFALTLAALLAFKYRGQWQWLWLLPPVMVVWVNSHGGFLLGIAVLGLFTVTEWWQWWRAGCVAEKRRGIQMLAWVLGATLLASLANPYFIKQWWFPFELMSREAMSVIGEWQRPDFSEPFFQGYLLCLLLFLGHYLSQKKTPDLTEWLLPGAMILASLSAGRHVPLAAMTMLPFFLQTLGRPSRLDALFGRWRSVGGGRELGSRENVFNVVLLALVVGLLIMLSPLLKVRQQQLKQAMLPVAAVAFIEQRGIHGRLFNQYRFGGYLLYRLYPAQRVFIDIRADMYGDAMMRDYTTMFYGGRGWEKLFARYHFDAVLCEREAPLVRLLLARGDFHQVYRDAHNVVLLRSTRQGAAAPARAAHAPGMSPPAK